MIHIADKNLQKVIDRVYKCKQEEVFRYWDKLSGEQKKKLLNQLRRVDFGLLQRLTEQALYGSQMGNKNIDLKTTEIYTLDQRKDLDSSMLAVGETTLSQGKAAAFLLAGGQGTRLGFDGPKGLYPVTPVKRKSLFQHFAEKLLDYELSSNNGNWQWAAGTGCDAATYFRVFNPTEQLRKFDKDLKYVKQWVPEYGKPEYPEPMVDHTFARQRALTSYKMAVQN